MIITLDLQSIMRLARGIDDLEAGAPAEARDVKALEWVAIEQDRGDGSSDLTGDYTSETPFGAYSIVVGWGSDSYTFDVYFGEMGFVSSHDDPNNAKAAAQADYTARILSTLKEQPK